MKPVCPDCGDRHDPHQAHVWNEAKNKPVVWLTPLDNAKKPSYRYRDPEARRKYMRELMRKRRAKAA